MLNEKGQHNSKEKRRTHRSDRAREDGFSAIELVLVMILVGIIAAIMIPRFPTMPKTGAAATRLTRDIRYAKELANRLQTMSGIYFIDSTSYRVFQDNDTNTATIDPVTGKGFVVTLSGKFSGVTLSQSFANNTLKFNALGTPLDGTDTPLAAASTITVSGTGGDRSVTVEPNTGMVSES
jgi:prepilin-type N-terminal cleavage/methylation domain-containing protein